MSYMVPTSSESRYKALMLFLDRVEELTKTRELNPTEYRSLIEFKLEVNMMRFGDKPKLEYPHWAEVYNRTQQLLDQPRRVPIAGGAPSERTDEHEESNAIGDLYRQTFDGDHHEEPHNVPNE